MLILTDGQVSGTEEILSRARALGVRLSCLGIGAASQDRFLTLLARETGAVSRFATPNEQVDLAAVDLFAAVGRPVATGLKAGGAVSIAPEPIGAVFEDTPVLLFGEASGKDTVLELSWDSGKLSLQVPQGDASLGKTLRLLQGSRLITDWESRYPAGEALATIEKRQQSRVAARLRSLSETYGLAQSGDVACGCRQAGERYCRRVASYSGSARGLAPGHAIRRHLWGSTVPRLPGLSFPRHSSSGGRCLGSGRGAFCTRCRTR
jgi:hypothetical protein